MDEETITLIRYQRDQIHIRDKLLRELKGYILALEMALLALGGIAIAATIVIICMSQYMK